MSSSKSTKVTVLASGGLDSTACLEYYLQKPHMKVDALFIDYGQSAVKEEYSAVQSVCQYYKINMCKISISSGRKFNAGLILGRNAVLLNTALMFFNAPSGIISIGIHAGTDYSDCSEFFVIQMQCLFDIYTNGTVIIDTPFISSSKPEIWEFCIQHKVPVQLTYSCEKGGPQCGQCLSCKDMEMLNATR